MTLIVHPRTLCNEGNFDPRVTARGAPIRLQLPPKIDSEANKAYSLLNACAVATRQFVMQLDRTIVSRKLTNWKKVNECGRLF